MIEDEIAHFYKGEGEKQHRSTLRIETQEPSMQGSFPRDGFITLRIVNGIGAIGFRLSPDEALRIGTELLSISKELMEKKRRLWNKKE